MRRLILATLLVGLVASGCGKSGNSNQGLASLDKTGFMSQVASNSVSQKTAKIAMTETVTPPSGTSTSPITITADGAMDLAKKVMELKMSFPAAAGISGTFDMIMAGSTIYMQIPASARQAAGVSKPWLGMKVDKLGGASPLGTGNLTDPTSIFEALKSVASNVTKVGDATVRGVKTSKYSVTLDLTKVAKDVPAAYRSQVTALNFDHIDVYVSDDKLVRREEFTISAAGASVTSTIDFFDYGAPISVSVPAKSDVEFKSLQDLMSGK